MGLEITPSGGGLGAVVTGVDVSKPLDPDVLDRLKRELFDEHLLLIFRGHDSITDEDQVKLGTALGGADLNVYFREDDIANKEHPEVLILSNLPEYGALGGDAELPWHTNISYQDRVALLALLYGEVTTPSEAGGQTSYANLYKATETLPSDLREEIESLTVIHSQGGHLRRGYHVDPDGGDVYEGEVPEALHSMLRLHPVTGRETLYGPAGRFFGGILGMPKQQALEVSERILQHATQEQFTYTHEWQQGDLLVWDNIATLHHRRAFTSDHPRVVRVVDVLEGSPSGQALNDSGIVDARGSAQLSEV